MGHIGLSKQYRSRSGPRAIKNTLCSTQLSTKFFLLMNVKMPTIVGILTFMSRNIALNAYLSPKNAEFLDIFHTNEDLKFHAQLS